MARSEQDQIYQRVEYCFFQYGWTLEQQKLFREFIEERFANYAKPGNTILEYLAALNHVVERIKKPFSEITFGDL
jgi:hypothetical protein